MSCSCSYALHLIDTMVKRAASLTSDPRYPHALRVMNSQLIEALLQLTVHPAPEGTPPNCFGVPVSSWS